MPTVNFFSLRGPVSRRAYAGWGFGLGILKYAAEAAFVAATSGRALGPLEFVSPSVGRLEEFGRLGDWAGPLYVVWTLPFVWVAAAMSVRRAASAGLAPFLGLLALAPFVNLPAILVFLLSPTVGDGPEWKRSRWVEPGEQRWGAWAAAGVLFGPIYTLLMVGACVYVLGDYGAPLFFLTPILIGTAAGYGANAVTRISAAETVGVATLAAAASYGGLLVVAVEGLVCLLMALPLALPLTWLGGFIGRSLAAVAGPAAGDRELYSFAAVLLLAPAGSAAAPAESAPVRPVRTEVVVNAPPAAVWRRVLAFPALEEPAEWYFKTGLSYPVGAAIEGTGVGAVRRCRFTTGTFVEPVTAWEPPAGGKPGRLAFDVAEQPAPMTEWHPWAEISPPHLHGTFESVRGEFFMEPLPGGRTRLIGTTWCRVRMAPHGYWAAWTDAILHRVHRRVLGHVAALAEADAAN